MTCIISRTLSYFYVSIFLCHMYDEGSVPEMFIWPIINSIRLKWCIPLSRSLFSYSKDSLVQWLWHTSIKRNCLKIIIEIIVRVIFQYKRTKFFLLHMQNQESTKGYNWSSSKSQRRGRGRNRVSGRVSVPCWLATPVANAPWKPLIITTRHVPSGTNCPPAVAHG